MRLNYHARASATDSGTVVISFIFMRERGMNRKIRVTRSRKTLPFRAVLGLCAAVILVSLFLSGCAGRKKMTKEEVEQQSMDDLRELVYSSISDPLRADQVFLVYEESMNDLQLLNHIRKEYVESLWGLNWEYAAVKDDFNRVFEAYDAKRKNMLDEAFELDEKLRELTTTEEYKALAKKEKKIVGKL